MESESPHISKQMDVDLRGTLGDDLGGFDGFEDLFAPSNGPDFLKFCALEEGQQEMVMGASAPPNPGTSGASTSLLVDRERDSVQDNWKKQRERPIMGEDWLAGPSMQVHGKPRARKRNDEDQALEREEPVPPLMKRRSSSASNDLNDVPSIEGSDALPLVKQSERSRSFDVAASMAWNARRVGASPIDSHASQPVIDAAAHVTVQPCKKSPPPRAIGVRKDLLVQGSRPRISVFMSKSRTRLNAPTVPLPASLDRSPRFGPLLVSKSTSPGSYSRPSAQMTDPAMIGTGSAKQLKDLRIVVRARTQAERSCVEMNPAVVAMGTRRGSPPPLDDTFAPPILQRATSVGALTIAGNGEAFCRSPALDAAGGMMPSYELSEHMQGGSGQRRNLVCKVFGSPVNGPTPPSTS